MAIITASEMLQAWDDACAAKMLHLDGEFPVIELKGVTNIDGNHLNTFAKERIVNSDGPGTIGAMECLIVGIMLGYKIAREGNV